MDRILNVIKCAICHDLLESPVLLPCSCNSCKKHVQNQNMELIRCEKCGVEHQIPINGFHANNALQVLIEAEIDKLDFGSVYKSAKKSCESFEETLNKIKVHLNDPSFYTQERISELKNSVQQKGEEIKVKIDEEMKKLMDRLEEYEKQSKEYLTTNEFKEESKKFEDELKTTQSNLDSWLECLNK